MNRICPKCQAAIPEANVNPQTGIALCGGCGEVFSITVVNPLPEAAMPHSAGRFCQKCGAQLGEGLQFCTKCGAPVGAGAVGAAQAVAPQPQPAPVPNPTVAAQTPAPQPVPQEKKRSSTKRIVLIAVAGVALLAILVILNMNRHNFAVACFDRGNAYYDKGDYDRAITDYNQAIRLDPNYAYAYVNRGAVYSNKGDYDRAIADYTQTIRLDPNYAYAYLCRGNAYYDKGDYDRTIADYTSAIGLNPNYADAYNNRGNAYYNKGDYDRAIADYEAALRIEPNHAHAKGNLEAARRQRAPTPAPAAAQPAPKLEGDYSSLHAKGYDYLYMKYFWATNKDPANLDRSIEYNSAAYALYPQGNAAFELTQAYYERGRLSYNSGKYAQAIADFEKCLSIDPEYAEASSQTNARELLQLARERSR